MRRGNWKACEAAAARDGNQKRVLHRWRSEDSWEAFSLSQRLCEGSRGSSGGGLPAGSTHAGRGTPASWPSDGLLGESFPLKLFRTVCPLRTTAV